MSKKIITSLKPFEAKQKVYVYEDGNKIDMIETTMKDLFENIFALNEKYNVNTLELFGSKKYSEGIKKQIEKAELTKYNKNKLEIFIK